MLHGLQGACQVRIPGQSFLRMAANRLMRSASACNSKDARTCALPAQAGGISKQREDMLCHIWQGNRSALRFRSDIELRKWLQPREKKLRKNPVKSQMAGRGKSIRSHRPAQVVFPVTIAQINETGMEKGSSNSFYQMTICVFC